MIRKNSVLLCVLAFTTFSIFLFSHPNQGHAANTPKTEWQRQNLEDFRKWREGIPDYELRVYNRLKSINYRTVQMRNIFIVGLLLVIALVFWFGTRISRTLRTGLRVETAMPLEAPPSMDTNYYRTLRDSQMELHRAVVILSKQASGLDSAWLPETTLQHNLAEAVGNCQDVCRQIDSALKTESTNRQSDHYPQEKGPS